jgi:hypothetical protein
VRDENDVLQSQLRDDGIEISDLVGGGVGIAR